MNIEERYEAAAKVLYSYGNFGHDEMSDCEMMLFIGEVVAPVVDAWLAGTELYEATGVPAARPAELQDLIEDGWLVRVGEGTELPDPPVDGFCKRPECGCRDAYKSVGKGDNE